MEVLLPPLVLPSVFLVHAAMSLTQTALGAISALLDFIRLKEAVACNVS